MFGPSESASASGAWQSMMRWRTAGHRCERQNRSVPAPGRRWRASRRRAIFACRRGTSIEQAAAGASTEAWPVHFTSCNMRCGEESHVNNRSAESSRGAKAARGCDADFTARRIAARAGAIDERFRVAERELRESDL